MLPPQYLSTMGSLFAEDDDQLVVNGRFVSAQDMYLVKPQPHVQRDDEDDADSLFTDDDTDVDETEPKSEDGPIELTPKRFASHKPPMSDPSLANPKGKGKERESTPTPEPHQDQNQLLGINADLLRIILGRQLEVERKYGNLQYAAIEEPRVPGAYEDFEDANFVPPKWGRASDMFTSHFISSFRSRVPNRRPQPEFVTGPSRITLDDL